MNNITLTTNELVLIAAMVGNSTLLGVDDPFSGMLDDEIKIQLEKGHGSLEKRGYVDADFDGNTVLNSEVVSIVRGCANCDTYISADSVMCGASKLHYDWYVSGGTIYRLTQNGTECTIQEVTVPLAIETRLRRGINGNLRVSVTKEQLQTIRESFDVAGELVKLGCPFEYAKLIADLLNNGTDYYSTTAIKFGNKPEIQSAMFIASSEHIVKICSADEQVSFEGVDAESAERDLQEVLLWAVR